MVFSSYFTSLLSTHQLGALLATKVPVPMWLHIGGFVYLFAKPITADNVLETLWFIDGSTDLIRV